MLTQYPPDHFCDVRGDPRRHEQKPGDVSRDGEEVDVYDGDGFGDAGEG